MKPIRVALVGDYNPEVTAHRAIPEAIRLACESCDLAIEGVWVHTTTLGPDVSQQLSGFAGLWCVPASPYANTHGVLASIRLARESGLPFLGTCGGFQYALLEYARNVLGQRDAAHAEDDPGAAAPVIAPLACSLVEKAASIVFAEGSRLRTVYGVPAAEEEYHCRYGLNPGFERLLEGTQLHVCGRDTNGEVRAVELDGHPFFIATLFQPERAALKGQLPPLVKAFLTAAKKVRQS
jgi:CTP synthase (UTP-ammonia lyase)